MTDLARWCEEQQLPVPEVPPELAARLAPVDDGLLATEANPPLMAKGVVERAAAAEREPLLAYGRAGRGMASRTVALSLVDGSVGVWIDRLSGNVHQQDEPDLAVFGDRLGRLWRSAGEALAGEARVLVIDSEIEGRQWLYLDGPAHGVDLWGAAGWTEVPDPLGQAAEWLGAMPRSL